MRGICQIIVAVALTVSAINAQNYGNLEGLTPHTHTTVIYTQHPHTRYIIFHSRLQG